MIAISDSLRGAPPRGKLLWLRDILPFNRPGLLPNLGREDDILPYGGWRLLVGIIQRTAFRIWDVAAPHQSQQKHRFRSAAVLLRQLPPGGSQELNNH